EVRGRLAAAYGFVDGLKPKGDAAEASRMQRLVDETAQLGVSEGDLHCTIAETFDLLRKYPQAAAHYAIALVKSPDLIGPRGQLGLIYMRLGQEAEAKQLLEESFEIDPFNVRVKNTLEVLDVLEGYAVLETEHFVIKFDRGQDQMLAEYAARYLEEEVYPDIVAQLGYRPQGKSLFEIFSRAKNTSGHGWFSARMVGLPYVGTVGACAGQMVAMVSPSDTPQPFNWERVLRHEFVHVVNLQQTGFNIPHWFTEALAVRSEGHPRPPDWTELLAKRHAADTLFTLDDINHGFFRPGAGDDWTLAYCQAEVYAEYMAKQYGEDSLAKMLAAYADNLPTAQAIERALGVSQAELETGCRAYIAELTKGLPAAEAASPRPLPELQAWVESHADDAAAQAELAYTLLKRKDKAAARKHALAALAVDPQQGLAAYVMAQLLLSIGDAAGAAKTLAESFDEAAPDERHLALLAALYARAGDAARAEELLQLGQRRFPHGDVWLKRLAAHYLKSGDDARLAPILEQLCGLDTENAAYRQKLALISLAAEDYAAAQQWAMKALAINLRDAEMHATRATALARLERHRDAVQEFDYALNL
ncbi:MAG: hypothetical protein KDA41_09080, partial [Planctomycetales bacterium]|nr:hypothetical protein [Planctomycetales bacterium]